MKKENIFNSNSYSNFFDKLKLDISNSLNILSKKSYNSIFKLKIYNKLNKFILNSKFLRSKFAFLIYSFYDKETEVSDLKTKKNIHQSVLIASCIEMIHSASLIHDDIIDNGFKRRGYASFYADFGTKKSILFGDILFVKSLNSLLKLENQKIYDFFIESVQCIIESEILNQFIIKYSKKKYINLCNKKTGSLFKFIIISSLYSFGFNLTKQDVEELDFLGNKIGFLFQIYNDFDDLFDKDMNFKIESSDLKNKQTNYLNFIGFSENIVNKVEEKAKLKYTFLSEVDIIRDEILQHKILLKYKFLKDTIELFICHLHEVYF